MDEVDAAFGILSEALYHADAFYEVEPHVHRGGHADVMQVVTGRIDEEMSDKRKRAPVSRSKDDVNAWLPVDDNGIADGEAVENGAEVRDGRGEAVADDTHVAREDVGVANVVVQGALNLVL